MNAELEKQMRKAGVTHEVLNVKRAVLFGEDKVITLKDTTVVKLNTQGIVSYQVSGKIREFDVKKDGLPSQ